MPSSLMWIILVSTQDFIVKSVVVVKAYLKAEAIPSARESFSRDG